MNSIFVGSSKFKEKMSSMYFEASKDFEAVLNGKDPIYAKLSVSAALDGGTKKFKGTGYTIVAQKSLIVFDNIGGYLYGPALVFDHPALNDAKYPISNIKFYTTEEFKNKFGKK